MKEYTLFFFVINDINKKQHLTDILNIALVHLNLKVKFQYFFIVYDQKT
jgi:hypothetical protein